MTTSARQPSGGDPKHLPPSASFLQQLLQEINSSTTPTVLRDRVAPQTTPSSRRSSNASRKASSVWIGGNASALNAREKLRAADEARMRKTPADGTNDTPQIARPILHLQTRSFPSPSSSGRSSGSSGSSSPRQDCNLHAAYGEATAYNPRLIMRGTRGPSQFRPDLGSLQLPTPTMHGIVGPAGQKSPLFFCDVDSDLSATPSPIEQPMSATSEAATDASTMSEKRESILGGSKSLSRKLIPIQSDPILTSLQLPRDAWTKWNRQSHSSRRYEPRRL
jgi:hypothetical protein